MKTVILLTGCINPDGMAYTALNNTEERKAQYVNAIRYYLNKTNYSVVFAENSGTDISILFQDFIDSGRFECLSYMGNQNKEKGKGYGEAEIIEFAINNSRLIDEKSIIAKITGRLIINNINRIIKPLKKNTDFVSCQFHYDLKFADSRLVCATTAFYFHFLKHKEQINDSIGVYFEHILSLSVLNSNLRYIPFSEEPLFIGKSGTTGTTYQPSARSIKNTLLYKCYSISQLIRINKISSYKNCDKYETLTNRLKLYIYKIILFVF